VSSALVLCYHALSSHWDNSVAVRPEDFRRHVQILAARGYRSVTFTEAVLDRADGRSVCITFDDAFLSVHRYALPVLQHVGYVATAFVPSAFLAPPRRLSWAGYDHLVDVAGDELLPMSPAELGELADAGWEIGSHTRTHPHLTAVDEPTLHDELARSRSELRELLGRPIRSVAYPYGDVDERVRNAARSAGYSAAAALGPQRSRDDPWWWPRVGVYRGDSVARFRLKIAPPLRTRAAAVAVTSARAMLRSSP
jgi:peptidoglycan/xylan/chitin deacetylase (PgdA/CDA1 family)